DALSLLDQAIAHGGGKVASLEVRAMLGAIDDEFLLRIAEALAQGDANGALRELAALFHRIALARTAPAALADEGGERERVIELAQALDPEDVQLYYQIAIHGRQDLPFAPDEYAGFTMALMRMLAFRAEAAEGGRPPAEGEGARPARAPAA